MTHILYVEDDHEIGEWVKRELQKQEYEVAWFISENGTNEVCEIADVIVLDVMLPGLDGFTLGQRFKSEYPDTPIIMLTARTTLEDKIYGLTFADDYITKPFHPKELIARIEVLLRRYNKDGAEAQHVKHLKVFMKEYRIVDIDTGEEIVLSGKQHQIFFYLMKNMNRTLTKEQIFEAVWNESYIEGDKSLMVHIRHLREKIERNPSSPQIIETIRGIGYRCKV
ncbi:response regulator transcription factor [Bacillus pseudomycoides]|uniref:DNA-binding response regulator n=1 Tax=Bacillus pseudomycoides TaxID=64104 RepID=A0A2B5HB99_9BACI|nr:response regulator transcription factor [Bacillus pseudomycoides]PDY47933.1 DNA-binding response regulator [Bacillus pseudomycoides]PEA81108.1 DNA-binding response regulator [Bacillus pseudomycoides]PED69334.1 DNA-binding response regulator [Bacillus pseudomycoides]PEI34700.1 DNA-binding response regulator [Bacillus pseudomycoides]PEJ77715.1 DNA-binding response regulator [Bacillus pseudomycoides]